MKKFLFLIGIAVTMVACKPSQETKQVPFEMPDVEDIAMYQVNPRVRLDPRPGRKRDVGDAHLPHRY